MKEYIKSIVALTIICAVIAVAMAGVNYFTAPAIKEAEDNAVKEALLEVLPDGNEFTKLEIESLSLPATVEEAYEESSGGYVFKLKTAGYSSDFIIMCGINADGKVSGALCIASGETLGYEKTFGESFKGLDADGVNNVDTIAGATKTTAAYISAVNDAISAFEILKGGAEQ